MPKCKAKAVASTVALQNIRVRLESGLTLDWTSFLSHVLGSLERNVIVLLPIFRRIMFSFSLSSASLPVLPSASPSRLGISGLWRQAAETGGMP